MRVASLVRKATRRLKSPLFILFCFSFKICFCLAFTVVDLSSPSLQSRDAPGGVATRGAWPRLGHSALPLVARGGGGGVAALGLLEGAAASYGDSSSPRRRRTPLTEGEMSSALHCPACGKVFAGSKRRYHLERHLITHTGERPFPCPRCPYKANVRENLARHVRHRHPDAALTKDDDLRP